ncbi:alpha/beta-hydrolase family protein [Rhizobium sp. ARZ01]|uniref:alpha/beta hydrolase n=1 Tax=Rhizobium sp. ARZ01 TaxID=2769313 RepID=UPI001780961A|nr:alpha/beta-hydrolase family protein [Rhizobium sp. ARZ01]MBD9373078.1 alpha/beta-hydrolase family protein [Rhizobium sp. ARZ01]
MPRWVVKFWTSLSALGLLLGALFFSASLTPSLLPRTFLTQGVLSGVCFAVGYGLGVLAWLVWNYLELPPLAGRFWRGVKLVAAAVCVIVLLVSLWRTAEWQNSIRTLMELPPVETGHPTKVGLIALLTFLVVIALARLFAFAWGLFSRISRRFATRRIANLIGGLLAVVLFWTAVEGVLFRSALHALDSSLRALDDLMEPSTPQPTDPLRTGSAASLVSWSDLGRRGREFVASGPRQAEIGAFSGRPAKDPIRVYVGLNAAQTAEERADLALKELIRAGGFQRKTLVVIVPTGTGWIDPEGVNPLEYLTDGDVASVAIQYSYLSSWLSLLVEPTYGTDAAQALFRTIYGHWTKLPRDARPKLYLYGLSLGALSSEQSTELFEVIGDPYQGALWVGPPFESRIWRKLTAERDAGTPAWLPRFGDGSFVRFTSQRNALSEATAPWGPMRIVYLQYASDPVTFFDEGAYRRPPAWMVGPRGPDVSPEFGWYPVVTFLQLGLDMAMATTTPMGYGHVYAGEHYIDGWVAVLGLEDAWTPEEIDKLKDKFRANRPQQ